ncbi:MAG: 50S ribosomal protein L11 methyltransferase [Fusobacteria bacterium]|nr:50S ribosomal protein L11 methyltransferase [Fusobacteriota bacterium]
MDWLLIKVIYESENYDIGKDIISNIFYDFGVQGLQLGEPMSVDPLDYYKDEKLFLEDERYVGGYFACNDYLEDKKREFLKILDEKAKENDILYKVIYDTVNEKDWADSWKKYFLPEKITEKLVVKPTWQEYEANNGEEIIEIDPGMAFGTGTHPTTYLCMNMIEKYIKNSDNVLDVGTGSGILMIASKKLGANKVCGVDIDDVAVKVATDNLKLNNIKETDFTVKKGDLINLFSNEKFQLVVSNILAEIIVSLLEDIKKVLEKNGIIILSGIIKEKLEIVKDKMKKMGIDIVEIDTKEEWVVVVGRLI